MWGALSGLRLCPTQKGALLLFVGLYLLEGSTGAAQTKGLVTNVPYLDNGVNL